MMRPFETVFLLCIAFAALLASVTYTFEVAQRYSVLPPAAESPCENSNVLFDYRVGYCTNNMERLGYNMED